ncbi:hypothetical protein HYQ44_015260 [Verticillium longisporum]|nr:hypothetical protein HYQ44_015260 [Verticillium longisporum]
MDVMQQNSGKASASHYFVRASGVAGAIARGLRADATLVFGQEEAGTAICVDSSGILLTCAHCVAEIEEELDLESSHWLIFESGQIVEANRTGYARPSRLGRSEDIQPGPFRFSLCAARHILPSA